MNDDTYSILLGGILRCELMHGSIVVAELTIDERDGTLIDIHDVRTPEHLPVGTRHGDGVDVVDLRSWWSRRSIPASRRGIREVLQRLGMTDTKALLMRSMGLSLSDQYWVRPMGSDVSWEDVNFFDNPFSEDVGDLLFGHEIRFGELNLSSPDNTTEGNLKKRWKNLDGRGCLIKTGSNMTFQEPFNEVAASILMTAGGIPHTDYRLIYDDGMPCCVCEDFVNRNTELVTAHSALRSSDTPWESVLDAYLGICDRSGLDITADIDRMIALDHIIANTDRHLNNFGIIRDAETLEWLSAAPIYDSGSSLGYDVPTDEISSGHITSCKPFSDTFRKQIRLASSLESVDLDGMRGILPKVEDVYRTGPKRLDDDRIDAICSLILDRIDEVETRRDAMRDWHRPSLGKTV